MPGDLPGGGAVIRRVLSWLADRLFGLAVWVEPSPTRTEPQAPAPLEYGAAVIMQGRVPAVALYETEEGRAMLWTRGPWGLVIEADRSAFWRQPGKSYMAGPWEVN